MKKTILLILGGIVTLVGLIVFVSPIPFGFAIVIPGVAMLIMGSDTVANWIKRRREEHEKLDEKLKDAEEEAPEEISEPLEKTDPDNTENCADDVERLN